MRLYYVVNARIPTERAHGIQITKMCEAFAKKGLSVTLVLPNRKNNIREEVFDFYRLQRNFSIKYLPAIDLIWFNIPYAHLLVHATFVVSLFFYFNFFARDGLIYARNEIVVPLVSFLNNNRKIFWETHIMPKNPSRYKEVFEKSQKIIVITKKYKEILAEEYFVPKDKIITASDGVDLEEFMIDIKKSEAREKLGLKDNEKIILYTGSDLPWKGLENLTETAVLVKNDIKIYLVGPKPQKESPKNIVYVGKKPYIEIPLWLRAADILVLSGTLKNRVSKMFTSPLKMFEYMASGRPIIAPKTPSFQEVLNKENAYLVNPDDPEALSDGIHKLIENDDLSRSLAQEARKNVRNYSWDKRADLIRKSFN